MPRVPAVAERVLAPAKVTLSLRVSAARADGYHEVDAEMVTVDLADELLVDPDVDELEVYLPGNEDRTFTHVWTGTKYEGGQDVKVALAGIPAEIAPALIGMDGCLAGSSVVRRGRM